MKRYLAIIWILSASQLFGQSSYFRVDNERLNFFMDKLDVASDLSTHTEFKPFYRPSTALFYSTDTSSVQECFAQGSVPMSFFKSMAYSETKDSRLLRENPWLNTFYRTESDFFHYGGKEFDVFINPIIGFEGGKSTEGSYFRNTRGAEIKGHIGRKVGFYTSLTDNQVKFPKYLSDQINREGVLPRQGFWKKFKEDGFDYFNSRGYITFSPIKQIKMAFGNDRNFIGNGYRSLVLSDYSKDYLNLKIQTDIGKVSYQNLFMELHNFSPLLGNTLIQKKYAVIHRLGVNLGDWGNIGAFESIIFSRGDSLGNGGGFDAAYLNPIIFYRAVEQNLGSKDNALLGIDFKANIKKKYSFYSQFILDEFKLNELKAGDGWWANKYGLQAGAKAFNILGTNIHAQVEYNMVRPFTYAHTFTDQSYSHYGQPLAHPLGANFKEVIGIVRYTPNLLQNNQHRLFITGKIILADKGVDSSFSSSSNFGGNIFASNATRFAEFGNEIGQGVQQKLSILSLEVSYMAWHNLYLDASIHVRNSATDMLELNNENQLIRFGIRYNVGRLNMDY